jgi:tRNA threonylcarbamoyladenosine biosynthesis protein TsaB
MAVILIIESSTEICSVSLVQDGVMIDSLESNTGQNHARLVTVFADELLKKNNISARQLSAVAVSKGPGSYTGLRIGTSTAKGICYARNIPLIAVGTLEAMAKHVALNQSKYDIPSGQSLLFCPMIDARRMEVYSMLLDIQGRLVKSITAGIVDEHFLKRELTGHTIVFFGNGSAKCRETIKSDHAVFLPEINASAKYMTELVWEAYNNKHFENVAYFEPFYLKDFVATVSRKNILS